MVDVFIVSIFSMFSKLTLQIRDHRIPQFTESNSYLNSPGRNVTIAGINPGQVAVAWSHKDLGELPLLECQKHFSGEGEKESYIVVFLGNLFSTIRDVATVMLGVHLVF